VFTVSADRFEELAAEALETLPAHLAKAIENVVVIVEDRAPGRPLFGLYEGVPLTKRSPLSYTAVMPDRITLYQDTISAYCHSEAELVQQIRKTVIHEVAHHFGISDPRLDELGWA
jgi:predicted Zn-dependent protease with MMP-like domain